MQLNFGLLNIGYTLFILVMTYLYWAGLLFFPIKELFVLVSSIYLLFGLFMVAILCSSSRDRVREYLDECTEEELNKFIFESHIYPTKYIQFLCAIFLIYLGGHLFAMGIFAILFVNKIFLYIVDDRLSLKLFEASEIEEVR